MVQKICINETKKIPTFGVEPCSGFDHYLVFISFTKETGFKDSLSASGGEVAIVVALVQHICGSSLGEFEQKRQGKAVRLQRSFNHFLPQLRCETMQDWCKEYRKRRKRTMQQTSKSVSTAFGMAVRQTLRSFSSKRHRGHKLRVSIALLKRLHQEFRHARPPKN